MMEATGLRHDRDFRLYWLARVASLTGSLVTAVAMPVLVYRLSHSALLTALATTLEALPYLIIGLFAGAIGDRWDRKKIMIVSDSTNVVVIGSVPLAWWLGHLTVMHALTAALVVQTLFTFFDGADFGALPVLVGRDRVAEANAAVWGVGGLLDLAVPAVVGVGLAVLHPADLLAVDALSFAASALLVRSIHRALSSHRGSPTRLSPRVLGADVMEGVRFLWGHSGVRSMAVVGALQSMAGAGFMGLAVVWSDRVLHIGTSGWRFGALFSVWGVGGVLASVFLPRLLRRIAPTQLTVRSIPLSGLAGLLVALSTSWWLATIAMTVWGVAYQLVLLCTVTYRQQVTPEHLLSRVNTAGRMLSWGLGWTFGATAAGATAAQFGVRNAMIFVVCFGLAAAVFAWASPLRHAADPGATLEPTVV